MRRPARYVYMLRYRGDDDAWIVINDGDHLSLLSDVPGTWFAETMAWHLTLNDSPLAIARLMEAGVTVVIVDAVGQEFHQPRRAKVGAR